MERDDQSSNSYGSSSSSSSSSFDDVEPPASFIQQIPEVVKLIMASFFVAIVVHNFFFKEKKRPSSLSSGTSRLLHDNTARDVSGCILGSGDALLEEDDDDGEFDESIISEQAPPHQVETETFGDSKGKKKKVKPTKKASMKRNYDKLVSEKEEVEPPTTADATENSSLEQDPPPENETQPQQPPPLKLHSQAKHPGLSAYYNWHATITSLYRIYAIPSRDIITNTFNPAVLPMHPSSERGNVAINITVANQTSYESIQVYWIDYKGNEIHKGNLTRGGSWNQTTYIGHPWTFRVGSDGGEESVLLKYVPFRIAPTVSSNGAETTATTSRQESEVVGHNNNNPVATQMFTLRDVPEGYVTRNEGYEPSCWVDDEILPEPPLIDTYNNNGDRNMSLFTVHEMQMAIEWSCFQMQREDAASPGVGVAASKRLLQYLKNICLQPDNTKYRRLRTGNRIFFESIYSTGARGVLLALGFEEHMGNLECGPSEGNALNYERLRHISDAMMNVNKALKLMTESDGVVQPEGVDGFGRAGFGYAGGMNL